MEELYRGEQIRVEALRFVGTILKGAGVQVTPNQLKELFPFLLEKAQKVERYIRSGSLS